MDTTYVSTLTVSWKRTAADRIATLKDRVMERGGSFLDQNPFLRDVALWRAARRGRSRVQIRAAFLHKLVKLAKIEIGPDWTLAGEHLLSNPGTPFAFQHSSEPASLTRIYELGVTEREVENVRSTVRTWFHGSRTEESEAVYYAIGEAYADSEIARGSWGKARSGSVYWAGGWVENHSIRDYAKVLRVGFGGIRQDIEQRLAEADIADPHTPQRENFWRAALHICDAGILLGRRYAELAEDMAGKATDPDERARLRDIAEMCARVPAYGASTFHEAVQSLWLAHILTCGEDGINANSIGRLDQILHPWYDPEAREHAKEIMRELAYKLYLDYDVQAITLGGVDREGSDATNELSYLILEVTDDVDLIRDVSVRLHADSPPEFIHLASRLIARGGGIPFIFNDDCFVKALHDHGITLEDARNYAPIGCIELTVPGRANPHAVSGWFSSLKCLELALYNGQDPRSGVQLGPRTGRLGDMRSFEDLFEAYCQQVAFFARQMVYHCNRGELAQRERGPLPCWSVLTDDCIARGRDITDGGAVYNYHSVCFLGTANTADAMMALKKLVFAERLPGPQPVVSYRMLTRSGSNGLREEGQVDADQLLDALRADFQGYETLRQMLLKRAPKYGNDCPEVDEIARQVDEHFITIMDRMRSPLDGRYFVHLFSFLCNIPFGKSVGATPDGRRAGEPLAYSLSAHQGRDRSGVTAMLNSLAQLPHDRAAGATAAIIDLDPLLVKGDAGVQRLAHVIKGAMDMGVGQLQWNVTTVERLLKAQQDPEQYGNIPVRVAGYSQIFRLIDKELQDHIIARTKHKTVS